MEKRHPTLPNEALPSDHFSLLAPKEKANKIPILPEVTMFDQAAKTSVIRDKKPRDPR